MDVTILDRLAAKKGVACVLCGMGYVGMREAGDLCGDLSYLGGYDGPPCPGVCIQIVDGALYRRASDVIRAVIAALTEERDALTDVLRRNGFVPCDAPACNCGSWHARYGLRERMDELHEILADAGHPLSNDNGNLVSRALGGLVEERDKLRARNEALERVAKNLGCALRELVAIVRGECPSLLDEDSGGDSVLSIDIDAALAAVEDKS